MFVLRPLLSGRLCGTTCCLHRGLCPGPAHWLPLGPGPGCCPGNRARALRSSRLSRCVCPAETDRPTDTQFCRPFSQLDAPRRPPVSPHLSPLCPPAFPWSAVPGTLPTLARLYWAAGARAPSCAKVTPLSRAARRGVRVGTPPPPFSLTNRGTFRWRKRSQQKAPSFVSQAVGELPFPPLLQPKGFPRGGEARWRPLEPEVPGGTAQTYPGRAWGPGRGRCVRAIERVPPPPY